MGILLVFLVILGGISKFYRRIIPLSLGLELKTFFTVVIAYAVNPGTAIICAAAMVIVSSIITNRFCHWIPIKIGVYTIMAGIVSLSIGMGVVGAGRIAVIFLNIAYIIFNALLKDFKIMSDLPGNFINVVFNFVLLGVFGQFMVNLLS